MTYPCLHGIDHVGLGDQSTMILLLPVGYVPVLINVVLIGGYSVLRTTVNSRLLVFWGLYILLRGLYVIYQRVVVIFQGSF